MSLTGLDGDDQLAKQMDPTQWPALKVWITEPFKTRDARRMVCADGNDRRLLRLALTMSDAGRHAESLAT
jgi:hypothetical protein